MKENIMEVLVSRYCRLATSSTECGCVHTLTLANLSALGHQRVGVRTGAGGMFCQPPKQKKLGHFWRVDRVVWAHRQRAKALVDACHPPLRFLWLAFVVLETANSCMQMALFPQGWPPLLCAWVWQGRFLYSIKEGVAFSQIRVCPPWSQQEYSKIVCLFMLFYSQYYW